MKSITDIFPEILNNPSLDSYLDIIPSEELKEFTRACLDKAEYTLDDEDLLFLENICDWAVARNQIQKYDTADGQALYLPTNILSTLIVAGILRRTYFKEEEPLETLFLARKYFTPIGKDPGTFKSGQPLNDQTLQQIFQNIEGQMGPYTPIESCAPIKNSPQEDFANAVILVHNMKKYARFIK